MRALVIGADGFAGRWLVRHLLDLGDEVHGAVGPRFQPPLGIDIDVHPLDVRDCEAVRRVVEATRPDATYYLAAVSDQGGREDLRVAVDITVTGSLNVLAALGGRATPSRLVFVSTGYVYPIGSTSATEDAEVEPTSVYPAAKLAAERALLALSRASVVEVLIVRPFNHVGPGQQTSFLVPTLAMQMAEALDRSAATCDIRVRDRSSIRDYSDVRDVVSAYRLIAERGVAGGTYNVASGSGVSVGQVIELMAAAVGVSCRVTADRDTDGTAPNVLVGDGSRVRALGWRPTHQLGVTLGEVVAEHRRPPGR